MITLLRSFLLPALAFALLPPLGVRGAGTTGMLSALSQLRLIGAAASPANGLVVTPSTACAIPGDLKALVGLFLAGGHDANNIVIPIDPAGYRSYTTGRGALALPLHRALPISPRTSDGHTHGLPNIGRFAQPNLGFLG